MCNLLPKDPSFQKPFTLSLTYCSLAPDFHREHAGRVISPVAWFPIFGWLQVPEYLGWFMVWDHRLFVLKLFSPRIPVRVIFCQLWSRKVDKMSRLMSKPTMWLCAQRRLRSAWASAQSDQSLRCPVWSESSLSAWRKLGSLATYWAHSEDSDQTGQMPRLIRVFAGHTVILLVSSWGGSYWDAICCWQVWFVSQSRISHNRRYPINSDRRCAEDKTSENKLNTPWKQKWANFEVED